ncbi:ankyrin repeat domain-containing protein SOWAHA [Salminus brasiliensis]|uniref:ankyrin repeat domain-containing protein SOWAHA n=1 Tax=Salminus brasiliensis TaxID=930266 RepID=UPI003B8383B6
MGDVSEASLLDYIYSSGGKVRNSDLLKTYKQFISHSDLQLRAKYREEFKLIIDRIAVCKSENGEKYLILKKKYRQQMQERECEAGARADTGSKSKSSSHTELQSSALEQQTSPCLMEVEERRKPAQVSWCGPTITVTEAQEKEHIKDEQVTDSCPSLLVPVENQDPLQVEQPEPTDGEDDLDKDSGSKSESEQEDECTGSVGSAAVALDPLEKEWIYSAACGRLSHLSQLLKQDVSLANKKDFTSGWTALHWAAKHGKEDMAVAMADAGADVNTKAGYTPLHIAALHGHHHIIDLLITAYGAKENLRDYSGHLASHYLNMQKTTEESSEPTPEYHSPVQVNERRNRKLTSLFHSRKKWGSAEDLAPVPEERTTPHQLMIPAFRPRKFSR